MCKSQRRKTIAELIGAVLRKVLEREIIDVTSHRQLVRHLLFVSPIHADSGVKQVWRMWMIPHVTTMVRRLILIQLGIRVHAMKTVRALGGEGWR